VKKQVTWLRLRGCRNYQEEGFHEPDS